MLRRAALGAAGAALGAAVSGCSRGRRPSGSAVALAATSSARGKVRRAPRTQLPGKPAMFYKKLSNRRIQCLVCPKECIVGDRERGYCGCKENRGGVYYTLVNGRAAAVGLDPIEKKPLFHFLPGTLAFSIAAAGCNFNCKNCQNWEISQSRPEQVRGIDLPAQRVVEQAIAHRAASVAYTYSEPVTFYEYMYDTSKIARKRGVRNVMITAGFINREPMIEVCKYLDAIKVDLKSMRNEFYKTNCDGWLQPVLDTIKLVHRLGKWLEIVYLVIPTLNDSRREICDLVEWILHNLGRDVPLHFSRFFGAYQLKNLPQTPMSKLDECYRIAREAGLRYVYVGNIPDPDYATTYCPKCGTALIRRNIYQITLMRLKNGACPKCGTKIPGVWR